MMLMMTMSDASEGYRGEAAAGPCSDGGQQQQQLHGYSGRLGRNLGVGQARESSEGSSSSSMGNPTEAVAGMQGGSGGRSELSPSLSSSSRAYSSFPASIPQARARGVSLDDEFRHFQHHQHHHQHGHANQQQRSSGQNYFLESSYGDDGYGSYLRQAATLGSFYHTDSPPYSPGVHTPHELSLSNETGRPLATAGFVTSAPSCSTPMSPSSPYEFPISPWPASSSAHAQVHVPAISSPAHHFESSDAIPSPATASSVSSTTAAATITTTNAFRQLQKNKRRSNRAHLRVNLPRASGHQYQSVIAQQFAVPLDPHRHAQFLPPESAYCCPQDSEPFSCFPQQQHIGRRGFIDMADTNAASAIPIVSPYPLPPSTMPPSLAGYHQPCAAAARAPLSQTAPAPPPPARTSEVDCYTCRRRRVKCDRQLPHCAKCERTKLECLGYKKPLVWNKGVASRGKMMGKTYPTPPVTVETVAAQSKRKTQSKTSGSTAAVRAGKTAESKRTTAASAVVDSAVIPRHAPMPITIQPSALAGSPFANLNEDSRFYLKYYQQRVARDFLLFDQPGPVNPYIGLLPRSTSNPALLNAMLAVSARHNANITGASDARALPYKGLSFHHLSNHLLQNGLFTETTLAVVMLFLFFEAVDGGADTWKIHLRGARRLIALLSTVPESTIGGGEGQFSMLRMFMGHVTLIDIIGNTLSSSSPLLYPGPPQIWVPSQQEMYSILHENDAYNFIGCPAELICILHEINILKSSLMSRVRRQRQRQRQSSSPTPSFTSSAFTSTAPSRASSPPSTCHVGPQPPPSPAVVFDENDENDEWAQSVLSIIHSLLVRIHAFSPQSYMATISSTHHDPDPAHIHLVSAYQHATKVYLLDSTLPLLPAWTTLFDPDLDSTPSHLHLRHHITSLPPGSYLVKGAVWLVYAAGTGAYTPEEREWVRTQLVRLWGVLPQWNIRNAGAVLEREWKRMDQGKGGARFWGLGEEKGENEGAMVVGEGDEEAGREKEWLFI